jgi:hypothetical protein
MCNINEKYQFINIYRYNKKYRGVKFNFFENLSTWLSTQEEIKKMYYVPYQLSLLGAHNVTEQLFNLYSRTLLFLK